jgi:hypothetical protein
MESKTFEGLENDGSIVATIIVLQAVNQDTVDRIKQAKKRAKVQAKKEANLRQPRLH